MVLHKVFPYRLALSLVCFSVSSFDFFFFDTAKFLFVIREVLQSEIRMQSFVKLGLRTHESGDGPENRHVVLQTEN